MIQFNIPTKHHNHAKYITQAIENEKLSGDGFFTKKCNEWMENQFDVPKATLTTSCTHALEMSAILVDIHPGDEIIAPSYTFVSTVNAFVLRGATIVFVDIRPDTMNIDEKLIEDAITDKTIAIVPVHYAGVACEMDKIKAIAKKHQLFVIEDAAQGVMAKYKGRALGTIGDLGCCSFHDTKNYTMGEGGALLVQNERFIERAEIIREKGTNRSRFFRGQIDKYTWVDIGSSYLPSELNAAFLYGQLEEAEMINHNRLCTWRKYYQGLLPLALDQILELPTIPAECEHNAHMFYIKCKDMEERSALISYLKQNDISTAFHYIPLHSSPAGLKVSRFHGEDRYTTRESERLLRLPMYFDMKDEDVDKVIDKITKFYRGIKTTSNIELNRKIKNL